MSKTYADTHWNNMYCRHHKHPTHIDMITAFSQVTRTKLPASQGLRHCISFPFTFIWSHCGFTFNLWTASRQDQYKWRNLPQFPLQLPNPKLNGTILLHLSSSMVESVGLWINISSRTLTEIIHSDFNKSINSHWAHDHQFSVTSFSCHFSQFRFGFYDFQKLWGSTSTIQKTYSIFEPDTMYHYDQTGTRTLSTSKHQPQSASSTYLQLIVIATLRLSLFSKIF